MFILVPFDFFHHRVIEFLMEACHVTVIISDLIINSPPRS